MQTTNFISDSELESRNAQLNKTKAAWLLYTPSSVSPLVGFVHASTAQEARTWAQAHGWPLAIIAPAQRTHQPLTREQIERRFQSFHTILAASSDVTQLRRTAYYHRKQAIEFAALARTCSAWECQFRATLNRLAKRYLTTYRQLKGIN